MGVGFIITIFLLAALLGMFSRQALASAAEDKSPEADHEDFERSPHSKAI